MSSPALLKLSTGLGAGLNSGGSASAHPGSRDAVSGQFARELHQAQAPAQRSLVTPAPAPPTPSPVQAPAPAPVQAAPPAPAPAPTRGAAAPAPQRQADSRGPTQAEPTRTADGDAETSPAANVPGDTDGVDPAVADGPAAKGPRGSRSALERWLLTGLRPDGSGRAAPHEVSGPAPAIELGDPATVPEPALLAATDLLPDAGLPAVAPAVPADDQEPGLPMLAQALAPAAALPEAAATGAGRSAPPALMAAADAAGKAPAASTSPMGAPGDAGLPSGTDLAASTDPATLAQAGDGRLDTRVAAAAAGAPGAAAGTAGLQGTAAIATAAAARLGLADAGGAGQEGLGGSGPGPGDTGPAVAQQGMLAPALPGFAAELARASGGGMAQTASPSAAAEVHLRTPVHTPEFAPRLGAEVALLARDGVQEARVHVNPVHLGPISVQITLDGNAAQVHLAVDNAQTRELLEQAMPGLAAALRESGLTLTGGGVFQQARQHGREATAGDGPATGRARDGADAADPPAQAAPRRTRMPGVLDVYA